MPRPNKKLVQVRIAKDVRPLLAAAMKENFLSAPAEVNRALRTVYAPRPTFVPSRKP